jgi:hypothetical protein
MKYRSIYRLHIWLAWLVGVPLLFWTISGLWMVARPIEEVRGAHLRREVSAFVPLPSWVVPRIGKREISQMTLERHADGFRWVISYANGNMSRADPVTGDLLPPITAKQAEAQALFSYTGKDRITSTRLFAADRSPLELRRERPAWRVNFESGTHVFVDAESGQTLRSGQWRAFDWMWGLHIMDLETREDTHHPILIGIAALAAFTLSLAFIQLIWRQRRMGKTR